MLLTKIKEGGENVRKKILMIGFLFFASVFAIKDVNAAYLKEVNVDKDYIFDEELVAKIEYVKERLGNELLQYDYTIYGYNYHSSDNWYNVYIYYREKSNIPFNLYTGVFTGTSGFDALYVPNVNSCYIYFNPSNDYDKKINECLNSLKNYENPPLYRQVQLGDSKMKGWFYESTKELIFSENKEKINFSVFGKELKVGDKISTYSSVMVPMLNNELLDFSVNDKDIYTKKVMRFSFSPYDPFKYHYYVSYDGVSYYEFPTEFLDLTFTANGKVFFKVANTDFEDVAFYSYEVNDIGKTSFLDPSLDVSDIDIPEYSDLENGSELPGEPINPLDFLQWFKNLYFGKFPIVKQVKEIYDKWSKYTPYSNNPDYEWFGTARCADIGDVVYEEGGGPKFCDLYEIKYKNKIPRLKINLSFLKINKEFEIVDMGVLLKYRNVYYPWIYLSLGTITLVKVISNSKRMLENWSVD